MYILHTYIQRIRVTVECEEAVIVTGDSTYVHAIAMYM